MSNRWMKRANEMAQYGFGPKAMITIKVCSHCGKKASATNDYCSNCGEALDGRTLLRVYQQMHPCCPVCETVAPDNALFCPVCGTRLAVKKENLLTAEKKQNCL